MKTWLIIISVVVVLLAASTGVGFWMLMDVKADLTDTEAELTITQAKLEENFGYWWEETAGEEYWSQKYSIWEKYLEKRTAEAIIHDLQLRVEELESAVDGLEWPVGQAGSISDMELRVEELEWAVRDLEWTIEDLEQQLQILESTLHIYGIY